MISEYTFLPFLPAAQWTNNNQLELGAQARAKVENERFVTHNNSIVTAQVGASVILHCKTSSATGGLVSAGTRGKLCLSCCSRFHSIL